MNISAIGNRQTPPQINSAKKTSFKAKLRMDHEPEMKFPRFDYENRNCNTKAIYTLQKAIKKFLAMPDDIVLDVRYQDAGQRYITTNPKNGLEYEGARGGYTGNNFLDNFISSVLTKEEADDISPQEMLFNYDPKDGRSCVEVFNKYKDQLFVK